MPGLNAVRHRLENGLVVVVKEACTRPAVTISVAVQAGSVFDPEGRSGLAHFLSRVIDRGTAHRSAEQIAEQLDACGVSVTITATRQALVASATCLSEDFHLILGLLGEVVRAPALPADEVEKRRTEILTLIGQDGDNPAVVAVERLFTLLFPSGHPYSRSPRGTAESVVGIGREDLAAFHAARLAPAVCSVVIVGDVSAERATAAAADAFGEWSTMAPLPVSIASPTPGLRRQVVATMPGKPQADIAYGFTTVKRSDPRYLAFVLMNTALGQYALGGRLGSSIRERQGMAYYVFSAFDGDVIETPLIIRAGVSPEHVERAVASIDEEVTRISSEGVGADELADCKRNLVGSMPRMLETNVGIARFLQNAEFFGLGTDYDLRLPGLLEAVTLDEVNAAAATLSPDRAAIAVAGPLP